MQMDFLILKKQMIFKWFAKRMEPLCPTLLHGYRNKSTSTVQATQTDSRKKQMEHMGFFLYGTIYFFPHHDHADI